MLANGAKLGYKTKGSAENFTDLPGLKEIPELGVNPEKVDDTCLTDPNMIYDQGIGELPDMVYVFRYDNAEAESPYRKMREFEKSEEVLTFQETLRDGTVTEFDAQVNVKRTGAGVNGVINFELSMTVKSEFKFTDPA